MADDTTIWERKVKEFEVTAEKIDAPDWLVGELSTPKRVLEMKFRSTVGGVPTQLTGIRVQHCNPHPTGARPFKGGTRYHPAVTTNHFRVFAADMTEKAALAGLPFGGAKGGIIVDPKQCSPQELCAITEKYTFELLKDNIPHPEIDVLGPDVGTTPTTMFWIYNKLAEINCLRGVPNSTAAVTGKPIEYDGIPGRANATSHGLLIHLTEYIRLAQPKLPARPTLAIQGIGNVGSNVALLTKDPRFKHFKVVAISNSHMGIYNKRGLDVDHVLAWYETRGALDGFPGSDVITNAELLELPVHILVPGAIENQITTDNASKIMAPIVAEGANEAVTQGAHDVLWDRGINVLPGVVANVGGVVVSYFEWRHNLGDRKHRVDHAAEYQWVVNELTAIMHDVTGRVFARSKADNCSISDAAHMLAMETLRDQLRFKHGYTT